MAASETQREETYTIYDLKVEVVCPPGKRILCGAKDGDYFTLRDEWLELPPGQRMSIYNIAAALPLLQAKQRQTHPVDWMTTDNRIACPDPCCPSQLKVTRMTTSTFTATEASGFPEEEKEHYRKLAAAQAAHLEE